MNKPILLGTITLVLFVAATTLPMAAAQYAGAGGGGATTLEEQLELAKRKVAAAERNPASGSGTPYLDASGVVGASAIAGAVFGGIAIAFVVKGRSGRFK
ncbi:MAG TPA: hypothetical protein VJJ01_01005 [Nitrosopumilaceae archaeon]|nr:hypothetical protein [Nitrosopumilaceae archaeon]